MSGPVIGAIYLTLVVIAEASNRNDRLWPVSRSNMVDLPQSSPFGPRLQISQGSRYDFHRGVDIPIPIGTPLYAIDDGVVRIGGSHPEYFDGVVQIVHTGWDEDPTANFYVNYIHVLNSTVTEQQSVVKGQIVAYSFRSNRSTSRFEHLHFEVRDGGLFQRHACNPWRYLPNVDNNYTSFAANLSMYALYNGASVEAVVNVSLPADQLTMNRVELYAEGAADVARVYDFCEDNLDHSFAELDDPLFEGNLIISPGAFSSRSLERGERATYGFHFLNLEIPCSPVTLRAVASDVFGNSVETQLVTEDRCPPTTPPPTTLPPSTSSPSPLPPTTPPPTTLPPSTSSPSTLPPATPPSTSSPSTLPPTTPPPTSSPSTLPPSTLPPTNPPPSTLPPTNPPPSTLPPTNPPPSTLPPTNPPPSTPPTTPFPTGGPCDFSFSVV